MTIRNAQYLISSAKVSQCPSTHLPEYAFIGRSNVGKSSLINALCDRTKLAKTSATPGKTMLINHFLINAPADKAAAPKDAWYIVDLPGYGFAKRSKKEQDKLTEMISSYILQRQDMTLLFLLIDIRHEPQKIDMEFIEWLGENGIPFAIVFTKADKLTKGRALANVRTYMNELSKQWEELPPHFITSSETKEGREAILQYIDDINKQQQEQSQL